MVVNINTCFTRMSRYNHVEAFDCQETTFRPRDSRYQLRTSSTIRATHPVLDTGVDFCITLWIDNCRLMNYDRLQSLNALKGFLKRWIPLIRTKKFDFWDITDDWVVVVGSDDYVCYQCKIDMNNNLMRSLRWLR